MKSSRTNNLTLERRKLMNIRNSNPLNLLHGAVLAWLCCGGTLAPAQANGQGYPPPVGAGIVAGVDADQDVYTNQPAEVQCPPCVTNDPPCMLPCYFVEGKTAVAQFTFQVSNEYPQPRTFQVSSGQQFDIEISDESGRVIASWSDDKIFTQALTSFTLQSG